MVLILEKIRMSPTIIELMTPNQANNSAQILIVVPICRSNIVNTPKVKKVCAIEIAHTEKCSTSICYHTKLSHSTQKCEIRSQHFYRIKVPTSVWKYAIAEFYVVSLL